METGVDSEQLRQRTLAYLEAHSVMTLATIGSQGPWAAAVFYASQGFDLIFLSAPTTRHVRDFEGNPQVAATIQEDYHDWRSIQGIQLEGEIELLRGALRKAAITNYGQKFPIVRQASAMIAQALTRVQWYRLRPRQLYFIDNSRRLGHRDQVPL